MIIHFVKGSVIGHAFLKHFKLDFIYETFVYTQHFRSKCSEEMRGMVVIRQSSPALTSVLFLPVSPCSPDSHRAVQHEHRDRGRWMVQGDYRPRRHPDRTEQQVFKIPGADEMWQSELPVKLLSYVSVSFTARCYLLLSPGIGLFTCTYLCYYRYAW